MTLPVAVFSAANRSMAPCRTQSWLRRSGVPGIIGSTRAVRSRAWTCGFSFTAKIAAFTGGARYRPITSRILSMSSGFGEILEVVGAPGLQPERPPDRCTDAGEIPPVFASSRFDQYVAPSGTSSRVRTIIWASLMVRGNPGRARRPARPAGGPGTDPPIDHRVPTDPQPRSHCGVAAALGAGQHDPRPQRQPLRAVLRFAQSNVRRSASDNTSGSSLLSPMPPAERRPGIPSPPSRVLRPNATHVVIRELKTGTPGPTRCVPARVVGWVIPEFSLDAGAQPRGQRAPRPGSGLFPSGSGASCSQPPRP
jgi:hypothetical protein